MLRLHFGNHLERLSERLVEQLGARDRSPFEVDEVVIPSAAMRRHLSLQIATHHGVCAQVRFAWLAQWLWSQMARVLPDVPAQSPWAPPLLAWRILRAFGDAAFSAPHPRLQVYLDEADGVMRLELAQRVAQLFDQYLTYRPEWLEAWLAGQPVEIGPAGSLARADEAWQAALWRRLVGESGGEGLSPLRAFLQALQNAPLATTKLPRSVHVFALPTMPPTHLALLQQIARHTDVQVYALNPCQAYWFDVVAPRQLAGLRARGRAGHAEVGHRLLASWGRQTRSHLGLLVDACGDGVIDEALFEPPAGDSLLARLQASILDLEEPTRGAWPLADEDRSLEVHVCHSLTREIEVLHDRLLGLFAAHPSLTPADVLVVTPDLQVAAPLVDAVFGSTPASRRIPYTLTGLARSGVNRAAGVLLELLSLVGSRAPVSRVFGVLQQPLVARRFGLDEPALEFVHDWLQQAGVHWGLDADHRSALGLPAQARHSLEDGLERLLLGYALPEANDEPFAGQLPAAGAEGQRALALGGLWAFAQALQDLRRRCAEEQPASAWPPLLAAALDDFVQADAETLDDVQELRQAIDALAAQFEATGFDEPLRADAVHAALTRQLDDPPHGGVPGGSVTFTSMSSLRGLPFAVVCLIGLDDGLFPGSDRPPEFDLMAERPRDSDRQRRHDERNLFLDLLLAARHTLHLSHVGRSVRDNAVLPPSVLVAELLDLLRPAIAEHPSEAASLAAAQARLVIEHPLQAFAEIHFRADTDPRLRSYHAEYATALQQPRVEGDGAAAAAHDGSTQDDDAAEPAMAGGPLGDEDIDSEGDDDDEDGDGAEPAAPLFFDAPLPPPPPALRTLDLQRLIDFFRAPCRQLLRQRLGIALHRHDEDLQDDEPFVAGLPERRRLAERLLPRLLAGQPLDTLRPLAEASHDLPAGSFGDLLLDQEGPRLQAFAERWRALSAAPTLASVGSTLTLEVDGERWQLAVNLTDLRPEGLARMRYDDLRGGDAVDAWLHHLALCALAPSGVALRSTWLARDGEYHFDPCLDPAARLADLLHLYRHGLMQPLYFFPRASWALLGSGREDPGTAARAWRAAPDRPFAESTDPSVQLALRGWPDPLNEGYELFLPTSRAVLEPLLAHLQRPEGAA